MVHSFEPFPASYAQLEKFAASSNGRIKAHRLACGSSIGPMDVVSDPNSTSGLNRLRPGNAGKDSIRVCNVKMTGVLALRPGSNYHQNEFQSSIFLLGCPTIIRCNFMSLITSSGLP
jgi:hypothetical protein